MHPSVRLYRLLALGEREAAEEELIEAARRNKVLLEALRRAGCEGELRRRGEEELRRTAALVDEVAKALDGAGVRHAFYKLRRPAAYVPSDVDVLAEDAEVAVEALRRRGFEVAGGNPLDISLRRGGDAVDIYRHPSVGGMAYMDGDVLLRRAAWREYNGVFVKSLVEDAEALAAAAHAAYKEGVYTLGDYLTVKLWASGRSRELAEETKTVPALELAVRMNEEIERGRPAPIRIGAWRIAALLARKIAEDPLARRTASRLAAELAKRPGEALRRLRGG